MLRVKGEKEDLKVRIFRYQTTINFKMQMESLNRFEFMFSSVTNIGHTSKRESDARQILIC